MIGLTAFCVATVFRLLAYLYESRKQEAKMTKKTKTMFAVSLLDVMFGSGTSVAATALLA